MFYTGRMVDPFKVSCLRCKTVDSVYTVPLQLPATEAGWPSLCADCFQEVLQVEPTEDLALQPIKHHHRGRRKWG
jgi:hypothetical protein